MSYAQRRLHAEHVPQQRCGLFLTMQTAQLCRSGKHLGHDSTSCRQQSAYHRVSAQPRPLQHCVVIQEAIIDFVTLACIQVMTNMQ